MEKILKFHLNKTIAIIVSLILLGFLLYFNSFHNSLFWDDYDGILNNAYIKNFQYWPKFFTENLIAGAGFLSDYWRPMVLMVFSFGWHLWQDNPVGYHFINILFHIANSLLLFFILRKLFKKENIAFLVALIFLIHPLQTEAITYVSGIADPLSTLFIFLVIISFIKLIETKIKIFGIVMVIFYIFSLMSKETAIMTPAILFLIGWFYFDNLLSKEKIKKIIVYLLPLIMIAFIYVGLRLTILNFQNTLNLYTEENFFTQRFDLRLLTFFKTIPLYFNFMFFPIDLQMERQLLIPKSIFEPLVIGGIIIIILLGILIIKNFKNYYAVSFGGLWFFILLLPVSNIFIPISGLIYEHWLYLPLIGIFSIIFLTADYLISKYKLKKIGLVVLIVFLIFLSFRTILRNSEWSNPVSFYQQIIKHNPNSYRVWNNLGIEAEKRYNFDLAKRAYEKAILIQEDNPIAYHNLGVLLFKEGDLEKAKWYFKKAIEEDKEFFYSYLFLAKIYWSNHQLDKAIEVLQNYLKVTERADIYFVLSQLYKEENNKEESIKNLFQALRLDPQNTLYHQEMELLQR